MNEKCVPCRRVYVRSRKYREIERLGIGLRQPTLVRSSSRSHQSPNSRGLSSPSPRPHAESLRRRRRRRRMLSPHHVRNPSYFLCDNVADLFRENGKHRFHMRVFFFFFFGFIVIFLPTYFTLQFDLPDM